MVTETEKYLFDLRGFIVIRDALTSRQVEEINEIIDSDELNTSKNLRPHKHYNVPVEKHRVFRDLIDNPSVFPYLKEWVRGTSWVEDHPGVRLDHCYFIFSDMGESAVKLHLGGTPYMPPASYHVRNDRIFSALTVVSYVLNPIEPRKGGFACIPGSHKSNFTCPQPFEDLTDSTFIESPHVNPGDAIIFTEALTHGTFSWLSSHQRRALFYKYSPNHMGWICPQWSKKLMDLCTENQKMMLQPPFIEYEPDFFAVPEKI